MAARFNPNFEGEDVRALLDTIAKARAQTQRPADARDRIIRAPLVHRMVHMNEDQEVEEDEIRPGKAVTKNLSNAFAHLARATACLHEMCTKLGQVHTDIRPENLLLHYGKDREIVYLLNDFDSSYTGRLMVEKYGEKAKATPVRDEDENNATMKSMSKHYTYEDMMEHSRTISES